MTMSREATPNLTHRVREYVRRHYVSDCSTSTLAARQGISVSALCHRYREAFGVTIGRDVRALRMRRARQLLRDDPDRLIKEVAAEVGYAHSTYRTFLNAFRAEAGMAPSRFAEQARLERLADRLRRSRNEHGVGPAREPVAARVTGSAAQSRIRSA